LTAAQNIVDTYQSIGGDTALQNTPVCQPLPVDKPSPVKIARNCAP
jgi:hypothetical protein